MLKLSKVEFEIFAIMMPVSFDAMKAKLNMVIIGGRNRKIKSQKNPSSV